MTYGLIPVSDPLPPDDFHTWAKPAPEPCPDCECCSDRLCRQAIQKDTACHWEGTGDHLADCPCWRQGSKARARIATTTDVLDAPAVAYDTEDPNAPGGA